MCVREGEAERSIESNGGDLLPLIYIQPLVFLSTTLLFWITCFFFPSPSQKIPTPKNLLVVRIQDSVLICWDSLLLSLTHILFFMPLCLLLVDISFVITKITFWCFGVDFFRKIWKPIWKNYWAENTLYKNMEILPYLCLLCFPQIGDWGFLVAGKDFLY